MRWTLRQKLQTHGLTLAACLFLGVYYYQAWREHALPRLDQIWQRTEIQLGSAQVPALKVAVWHIDGQEVWSRHAFFNTRYLGAIGHILNYWQDIGAPEWSIMGRRRPLLWYFGSDEISYQGEEGLAELATSYGAESRRFVEALRKRGVTCILLAIPTKAQIERDSIPQAWKRISDPGVVYRRIVQADPAWTPDLFSLFTAYKREHPDEFVYRPLDHHWDSLGIALAASETLNVLRRQGWKIPKFSVKFLGTRSADDPNIELNERELLFLPWRFIKNHPELDWNERMFGLEPKAQARAPGRVLVFGGSYTTQLDGFGLSYGQLLAQALGRTLVNASADGSTFLLTLKQSLEQGLKFQPGDLVILEFPLNQLSEWKGAKDFHDLD